MDVVNLKIKDLKPYEKNPRKNDGAVEYVANSIKEFGFKVPIVVDVDNVIVAGHTRYKAAKKLGLKEKNVGEIKRIKGNEMVGWRTKGT